MQRYGPGRVVGGAVSSWSVVGVARACGRETWRARVAPEPPRGDAPVPPVTPLGPGGVTRHRSGAVLSTLAAAAH